MQRSNTTERSSGGGLVAEDVRVWSPRGELLSVPRFALNHGAVGVVLGPRGAGKTLFLLALAGLVEALTDLRASGRVRLGDEQVPPGGAGKLGPLPIAYVPPTAEPFPGSVVENLLYAVQARFPDRARDGEAFAYSALDGTGLLEPLQPFWRRPAAELGPWELRVLAMARAVVLGPKILLLDAPETGLEETEVAALAHLVRRQRGPRSLVWATRRPRIAARLGDEVAVLRQGRLLESGSAAEIFLNPRQPETERYLREAAW